MVYSTLFARPLFWLCQLGGERQLQLFDSDDGIQLNVGLFFSLYFLISLNTNSVLQESWFCLSILFQERANASKSPFNYYFSQSSNQCHLFQYCLKRRSAQRFVLTSPWIFLPLFPALYHSALSCCFFAIRKDWTIPLHKIYEPICAMMAIRQVVRRIVDFPPMFGPVRSMTLESRLMSLAMMSPAFKQGCFASTILKPSPTN